MKPVKTSYELKIPFYDVDPMNIVWHGNYVKYIEEARCDFFKQLNYTYMDMYNDGVMFPVAKIEIKYVKSAHFGDDIQIVTELYEIEPALIFKYTIFDTNGEKLCIAKTMQIAVNKDTNETLYELPEKMKKRLESYE